MGVKNAFMHSFKDFKTCKTIKKMKIGTSSKMKIAILKDALITK